MAGIESPPLAIGTYPAWYTAALRTSDPSPGDGLPEYEAPESEIRHDTFRFHLDMNVQPACHPLALLNVQRGFT
jgi:hypothetical protein